MPDTEQRSPIVGCTPDNLKSNALPREPSSSARRWWHWHEPGTTKEEKWLIFKLDFFILLYSCLVCHGHGSLILLTSTDIFHQISGIDPAPS